MVWDIDSVLFALGGGLCIGAAAALLLLFNGRIAGISGIVLRSFSARGDRLWRWFFLAGLIFSGIFFQKFFPNWISLRAEGVPYEIVIVAGLLVGLGSVVGNGCTSGHGVCGISRFSWRSMVATIVFMGCGMATVFVSRHLI